MGLEAILESEDHCQTGYISKTVHPSQRHCPRVKQRDDKEKPSSRDYLLGNIDRDFREIRLDDSLSPYRRSMPSRPVGMDVQEDEVIERRGSVYQTSREVRRMRKLQEHRRKTESTHSSETFLSFEIVNSSSLHCQNEGRTVGQKKRSPPISSNKDLDSTSLDTMHTVTTNSPDFLDLSFRLLPEEQSTVGSLCSGPGMGKDDGSDDFLEIALGAEDSMLYLKAAPKPVRKGSSEASKLKCDKLSGPENDGNVLSQREKVHILAKSFSAKVGMLSSLNQADDDAFRSSPKSRFSPHKRMLDPMTKSKSQRNLSLAEAVLRKASATDAASIRINKALHKSLLNDLSRASHRLPKTEVDVLQMGDQAVEVASSPVHLNGMIKLESRHGLPSFEFILKNPEDVLSAKMWRTGSPFNWVYTFHRSRRKNGTGGWGIKDRHRQSPVLIGQMQARRSFTIEERSHCPSEAMQPPKGTIAKRFASRDSMESNDDPLDQESCKPPSRHGLGDCDSDASDSNPWAPADLLPHMEIGAIVIQVPFEMKENLKDRKKDETNLKEHPGLSSMSVIDQNMGTVSDSLHPVNMKVITPSGSHGIPSTEGVPSTLLHRWRSGGGCDCGGWDMGCPIVVLDNKGSEHAADCLSKKSHQSFKLFVQGTKDNVPALTMTTQAEGQYSVHFHAQFSTLQAFSICIAILHSLESSTVVGQESDMPRLHSNSLKLLLEEEVRHLLGAVAEKEKIKAKKKAVKPIPSRYMLDRPFSPIGRV